MRLTDDTTVRLDGNVRPDGEHRRRKLIEVAVPLDAINSASASEKLIHVGTTSNLHAWWARRPLAACRAVAFASLIDDPGEHLPPEAAEVRRAELFSLIERLVRWDSNNDDAVLERARSEIRASTGGVGVTVVDPFCGSGSIPLEALRLGLDTIGLDLNPVAVAISKAVVEVPDAVAGHPPINPNAMSLWKSVAGFSGFKSDLEYYSRRVGELASKHAGGLYDGTYDSKRAPIAWLWSRTAQCPNPACGARIPLVSSMWLSKTRKNRAYLQLDQKPSPEAPLRIGFSIVTDDGEPGPPPLGDAGAHCPRCGTAVPFADLREQGKRGLLGFQMNAYVTREAASMEFHAASSGQESAALAAEPRWVPDTALPDAALGFRVQNYGISHHKDLFLPRQLAALSSFAEALEATVHEIRAATAERAYGDALALYLAIFFDRLVQTNNALVRWFTHPERPSKAQPTFDKQTVQMIWDFAEANPLADATGGWEICCKYPQTALDCLPTRPGHGTVRHGDSATLELPAGELVFSTDPPYFDNIGYADLSDFFYIWLRRVLKDVYPDAFQTLLVPKSDEIISDPSRHGGDRLAAREFFYQRMAEVFTRMRQHASREFPATIFYAFKQEESTDDGGAVSTGWERMLQALLDAGWRITATWPIRTEHANRPRSLGANALASSIVLACRPRDSTAGSISRRELLSELRLGMPEAVSRLQRSNIAPVDLAQAAIGPGMAIFSKYGSVLDAAGRPLAVREALALINRALGEILIEQEGDFDAETRWAITWFDQSGYSEGPFDSAETLSKAKVTSVRGMVDAGIIESSRGRVRLLRPHELPEKWDPDRDRRLTAWEITHHLIRSLEHDGENGGAALMRRLGDRALTGRELAYRLFALCERRGRAADALAYNALIQSWSGMSELTGQAIPEPQPGLFDDSGA